VPAAVLATPIPKGATVGATKDVVINGDQNKKDKYNLYVPKNTQWEQPTTLVQAAKPGGQQAVVTFVPDADGVNLKLADGKSLSCRLHSIDAPEVAHDERTTNGKTIKASPNQSYGQESKDWLSKKILNKEVTVVITQSAETSKQGRNFCQVSFEGEDISISALENGFAMAYDKFVQPALAEKVYDAQLRAKEARRGLWKDTFPERGEDFRNRFR
jgi:micrococcal nuclease